MGDLTESDLPDSAFDFVWTQHVVMNIHQREKLYREFCRVLKPGGRFMFYDVIAADKKPELYFPVPWAETEATSFLLTKDETLDALQSAGLNIDIWNDVAGAAMKWFAQQQQSPSGTAATLAGIPGSRFAGTVANLGRNLRKARVQLVMGSAVKRL